MATHIHIHAGGQRTRDASSEKVRLQEEITDIKKQISGCKVPTRNRTLSASWLNCRMNSKNTRDTARELVKTYTSEYQEQPASIKNNKVRSKWPRKVG